ncbi:STAS domain-containing protein [Actinoplanes regularis]|uniref:STAS domain-containing protein n=1 Tax=Actinoplanes regularis TaxID=52697 RepID=UPI0024A2C96F|nr:STAS domain-containing protein [Actinoplanes regularis]GLW28799.1 hypothetical protein Areg01_17390 [Actinoplanes regularis]
MDQDGQDPAFSATTAVSGDRVTVTVAGEVDMSTADALFRAATPELITGATIDLRAVTFFDSAAIHTLILLAERYPDTFEVIPSDRVHRVLDISGLGGQPWLRPVG